MEDIEQYIVIWLYQSTTSADGRFLQGSQQCKTADEAVFLYSTLKEKEATGEPFDDELVSHITIVNQVGRDISATLVTK